MGYQAADGHECGGSTGGTCIQLVTYKATTKYSERRFIKLTCTVQAVFISALVPLLLVRGLVSLSVYTYIYAYLRAVQLNG